MVYLDNLVSLAVLAWDDLANLDMGYLGNRVTLASQNLDMMVNQDNLQDLRLVALADLDNLGMVAHRDNHQDLLLAMVRLHNLVNLGSLHMVGLQHNLFSLDMVAHQEFLVNLDVLDSRLPPVSLDIITALHLSLRDLDLDCLETLAMVSLGCPIAVVLRHNLDAPTHLVDLVNLDTVLPDNPAMVVNLDIPHSLVSL